MNIKKSDLTNRIAVSAVVASLILFFVMACNISKSNIKLGLIDITGARALMVAEETAVIRSIASLGGAKGNSKVFVKVTADNTIENVTMQDADGNVVTGIVPTEIIDLTSEYLIIVIDIPYLINKQNGYAYDLSPVGTPDMGTQSGFRSTKRTYSDGLGNIYYVVGGRVRKIDITNPDQVTAENYTTDLDIVYEFAVDNSGTVLYSREGHYHGDPSPHPCRIRKANGGLYNTGSEYKGFFTGLDGHLYCNKRHVNDQTYPLDAIYQVVIDSNFNVSFSQYGNIGSTITDWGHVLYFNDRIININCQEKNAHEVYTSTGYPRPSTILAFLENGILVKQSNSFFYVVKSNGSIIKVNPIDYSYTTLISDNNYEIYKLDATNDDVVLFNALRLSDGKKVLGNISPSGVVEIIDDTLTEEISILQRVN